MSKDDGLDTDGCSGASQAAGREPSDTLLRDAISIARELNESMPPVIFTSPFWNGMCFRVEETGDLAVGDDAISVIRIVCQANADASPPDPRLLAHSFMGVEIVSALDVLNDPKHRLYDRMRPLAAKLFQAACSEAEATQREGEARSQPQHPKE